MRRAIDEAHRGGLEVWLLKRGLGGGRLGRTENVLPSNQK
jgi:hypothetical protein